MCHLGEKVMKQSRRIRSTIFYCYFSVACFLLLQTISGVAGTVGDIDGNGSVGLSEAIYALQVSSGAYPDISPSCQLEGKGQWQETTYSNCDVVLFDSTHYVCSEEAGCLASDEPGSSANWVALVLQTEQNDQGNIQENRYISSLLDFDHFEHCTNNENGFSCENSFYLVASVGDASELYVELDRNDGITYGVRMMKFYRDSVSCQYDTDSSCPDPGTDISDFALSFDDSSEGEDYFIYGQLINQTNDNSILETFFISPQQPILGLYGDSELFVSLVSDSVVKMTAVNFEQIDFVDGYEIGSVKEIRNESIVGALTVTPYYDASTGTISMAVNNYGSVDGNVIVSVYRAPTGSPVIAAKRLHLQAKTALEVELDIKKDDGTVVSGEYEINIFVGDGRIADSHTVTVP